MRRLLLTGLLLAGCIYLDSVDQPAAVNRGEAFKITVRGNHSVGGRSARGWLAVMLPSGIFVDSARYWTSDSISGLVTAPDSLVSARAREAYPADSSMCWWGFASVVAVPDTQGDWVAELFARVTDSAPSGEYLVDYRTGNSYAGNLTADSILDQPMTVGPVGASEGPPVRAAGGPATASTISRGVLCLPRDVAVGDALLDAAGRKVLELRPGANDVRHLSPGSYFVHSEPSSVHRVILAR